MLKTLRRKFILLNMLTVSLVVVTVLAVIGFTSYQQDMTRAYESLENSINLAMREDAASFPFSLGGSVLNDRLDLHSQNNGPRGSSESNDSLDLPKLGNQSDRYIPTAVYRSYSGGSFTIVTRATSASLSDEDLSEAISLTEQIDEGQGSLPSLGLLYVKKNALGYHYLAFADEANASSWKQLVLVLVGIGILSLLAFFVISLFFSKWALRPVETAWDQQRRFVADASHELKTPITVILANMSIMLKHPQDSVASQSQWVESTQHEALGMQELVTDLLDLARLEQDNAPMPMETIDLSTLTESRLLQFDSVAFERNVITNYTVEPGLSVMGSNTKLQRVVAILLDNACKYATEGSTISITLERRAAFKAPADATVRGTLPKGQCAVLSVTNQGQGISAECLPHVFDRFYRSDQARVRAEGSYGLGLAIAAETVNAHQGAIIAQSDHTSTTTFTVVLPLA